MRQTKKILACRRSRCGHRCLPPLHDYQNLPTPPLVQSPITLSPEEAGEKQNFPCTGGEWSSLPTEIWSLILQKLPLEDCIRFGTVNSEWQSIVRGLKYCSSQPRIPWLMKPSYEDPTKWNLFDMANNDNKQRRRIYLPELRKSVILGSNEGWLIHVDKRTVDIQLFNPFTRAHIQLPPTITFPGIVGADHDSEGNITRYHIEHEWGPIKKKALDMSQGPFKSAILESSEGDYIVIITKHRSLTMAFAKKDDKKWRAFSAPDLHHLHVYDSTCTLFKGAFYMMYTNGTVFSIDLNKNSDSPAPLLRVAPPLPSGCGGARYLLVLPESSEIVVSNVSSDRKRICIFKQDQKEHRWVEVNNMYGYSLFLSGRVGWPDSNMCFAVKEHPPEVKGNCIYHMKDESVEVWDTEDPSTKPNPVIKGTMSSSGRCFWLNPVLTSLM